METRNLLLDDADRVHLKCRDDLICLGFIESCDEECPSLLAAELAELRAKLVEAEYYGRAYEATVRAADAARHSPGGWR